MAMVHHQDHPASDVSQERRFALFGWMKMPFCWPVAVSAALRFWKYLVLVDWQRPGCSAPARLLWALFFLLSKTGPLCCWQCVKRYHNKNQTWYVLAYVTFSGFKMKTIAGVKRYHHREPNIGPNKMLICKHQEAGHSEGKQKNSRSFFGLIHWGNTTTIMAHILHWHRPVWCMRGGGLLYQFGQKRDHPFPSTRLPAHLPGKQMNPDIGN